MKHQHLLDKIKMATWQRLVVAVAAVAGIATSANAALTFSEGNTAYAPIAVDVASSTGLDKVYVLWQSSGMKATFTSGNASAVKWYRFSALGGGYAEEITAVTQGNESSVYLTADDMGYIVESDGRQQCYWIVNYANHKCSLSGLDIAPEQDCERTALLFTGEADKILYYSVTGAPQVLSRDLTLNYNTLVYNEEQYTYELAPGDETLESAEGTIRCDAPLCDTSFVLSGDRFLRQWGIEQEAISPTYTTTAVEAHTYATQTTRSVDNEQNVTADLGGSGPVEITFLAVTTDAAVYKEWQFSTDANFEDIDLRIQENEVVHTFNDEGTTYVRFVVGDSSGNCDKYSDTYTVFVGESDLKCPNAFSPGASEGVNDEWKVSYKSLIEFDCHIFNRWGLEMAHLTDPSQGWDGRYKGKLVPAGVYYYVIKARGTDGKVYKKSGDINIIKYKSSGTTTTTTTE
jgi:gliding motility-associated-like protein